MYIALWHANEHFNNKFSFQSPIRFLVHTRSSSIVRKLYIVVGSFLPLEIKSVLLFAGKDSLHQIHPIQ